MLFYDYYNNYFPKLNGKINVYLSIIKFSVNKNVKYIFV